MSFRSFLLSSLILALLLAAPLPAQGESTPKSEGPETKQEQPAAAKNAPSTQEPTKKSDPLLYGVPVPKDAVAVIGKAKVSLPLFFEELVAQQLRGGRDGPRALEALVDEVLITNGLRKRGIEVQDEQVEAKLDQLRRQLRAQAPPQSLEDLLKQQQVPMPVFRRKLERVVALEALARRDLPVPEGKPVENLHLNAWLRQAKEDAEITRYPDLKLPRGVAAKVGQQNITIEKLGRELLLVTHEDDVVRTVNVLLEGITLDQILAEGDLKITKVDFDLEWEHRRREFKSDPKFRGVNYEDVLQQRTGLSAAAWRKTREFRIAAGRGLLARKHFSQEDVLAAFEANKDRYGPIYVVSHILVRATEDEKLAEAGGLRSKADGLARVQSILAQINEGLSFADAAQQYSEDRGSQFRGGTLPHFTPGNNPYELAIYEAVKELEVGKLAAPTWTRLGWHIISLDKRLPVPEFTPAVATDLRRYLVRELFTKRMRAAKIGWNMRRLLGS